MLKNDEPTIDDIKAAIDIVGYIAQFCDLKKNGVSYVACCPIHGEKSPSLNINEKKKLFHCFGCGAGGSVIDFAAAYHGFSVGDAINMLKREAGYDASKRENKPVKRYERKLTPDQQIAKDLIDQCESPKISGWREASGFDLMLPPIHQITNRGLRYVVPLYAGSLIEDALVLDQQIDGARGLLITNKPVDAYYVVAGDVGGNNLPLYICVDFVDAVYISQQTQCATLYAPWASKTAERITRDYPSHQQILVVPHNDLGGMTAANWHGEIIYPAEAGFFVETDRKQLITRL
jgi:hypothetical protein